MDEDHYHEEYEKYLKKIGFPEKTVTTYRVQQKQHIVKIGLDTILEFDNLMTVNSHIDDQQQTFEQSGLFNFDKVQLELSIKQPECLVTNLDLVLQQSKSFELLDNQMINQLDTKQEFSQEFQIIDLDKKQEQDTSNQEFKKLQDKQVHIIFSCQKEQELVSKSPQQVQQMNNDLQTEDLWVGANEQLVQLVVDPDTNSVNTIKSQDTQNNQYIDQNEKENIFQRRKDEKEDTTVNLKVKQLLHSTPYQDIEQKDTEQKDTEQKDTEQKDIDKNEFESIVKKKIGQKKEKTIDLIQQLPEEENRLQNVMQSLFKNLCRDPLIKPKYKQEPQIIQQVSKRQQKRDKLMQKKK